MSQSNGEATYYKIKVKARFGNVSQCKARGVKLEERLYRVKVSSRLSNASKVKTK